MGKENNLTDFVTDIADAIRAKTGKTGLINPQDFSTEISNIATHIDDPCVKIIDYDGTVLHSYTREGFLALTEYPDCSRTVDGRAYHSGEFTYDFAKAQKIVRDSEIHTSSVLNIGLCYWLSNNDTYLYITLDPDDSKEVCISYSTDIDDIIIDWGDGTEKYILDSSNNIEPHIYETSGEYVITISNPRDLQCSLGTNGNHVLFSMDTNLTLNKILKKAFLSPKFCYGECGFEGSYNLSNVIIGTTSNEEFYNAYNSCASLFMNCYNLNCINIPKCFSYIISYPNIFEYSGLKYITCNSTSQGIGSYAFNNCKSLKEITFYNVTNINLFVFRNCCSLESAIITGSYNEIPNGCFDGCTSLNKINFLSGPHTGFPNIIFNKKIGERTFASTGLQSIVLSGAIIGSYCFANCRKLESILLSNITYFNSDGGDYAFDGCTSLSKIDGTFYYKIPNYFIRGCTSLSSIKFKPGNIASYSFNDSSLRYIDFSSITSIPNVSTSSTIYLPPYTKVIVPQNLFIDYCNAKYFSSTAGQVYAAGKDTKINYVSTAGWSGLGDNTLLNDSTIPFKKFYTTAALSDPSPAASYLFKFEIEGYDTFTFYVGNCSEYNYDFMVVGIDRDPGASPSTSTYDYRTKDFYKGTNGAASGSVPAVAVDMKSISNYMPITLTNLGNTKHTIYARYSKDSSLGKHEDKGYILIPANIVGGEADRK